MCRQGRRTRNDAVAAPRLNACRLGAPHHGRNPLPQSMRLRASQPSHRHGCNLVSTMHERGGVCIDLRHMCSRRPIMFRQTANSPSGYGVPRDAVGGCRFLLLRHSPGRREYSSCSSRNSGVSCRQPERAGGAGKTHASDGIPPYRVTSGTRRTRGAHAWPK